MVNKIFTLDCRNIKSLEDFHDVVERVLCPDINYYGRNWDAFNDILRGGFGTFDYEENITLIFSGRENAEKLLGEDFLKDFIEMVELHDTIELIFED
ncbi:MAG: hypothetical protein FK734_03410 [Asgard group archaeon]|nr:hypothetical protein [Asgard group archaeon]